METAKHGQAARAAVVGSLLCTVGLLAVLSVQDSPTLTAALLAAALVTWGSYRALGPSSVSARVQHWAVAIAAVNLMVVVPELALRAGGYSYSSPGLQVGLTRAVEHFVPDSTLFWKMPPGSPGANSMGFPGPDVRIPKPTGTYRIVFLGDSCTQQGYPDLVASFLNADATGMHPAFESVTMALVGYSSYQGRLVTEQYAARLEPDLAVVYYGWNDHWLAQGAIDSKKTVSAEAPASSWFTSLRTRSRLLQAMNELGIRLFKSPRARPLDTVRVAPEQYRANLEFIASRLEDLHARVIFITAPTAHYRKGVPDRLITDGYAPSKAFAIEAHRQYNQIVRDVSAARGALLLDLEQEFNELTDLDQFFMADGIHFTSRGLSLVANRLSRFIEQAALPR